MVTSKRTMVMTGLGAALLLGQSLVPRVGYADADRPVTPETRESSDDGPWIDQTLRRAIDKVLYRLRSATESVLADIHGQDVVGDALRRLTREDRDLRTTDEQRAKLRAILNDYEKTRIRGEADYKVAELDVQSLVRDESAKAADIEAALKRSEAAHTVLRLEGIKALRNAAAVLTPEQREKMKADLATSMGN